MNDNGKLYVPCWSRKAFRYQKYTTMINKYIRLFIRNMAHIKCYRFVFERWKNDNKMSKTVIVFGVELTPTEEMKFQKYRSNNEVPAFNTITAHERTEIVKCWRDKYRALANDR